jgi:hypothetical protein
VLLVALLGCRTQADEAQPVDIEPDYVLSQVVASYDPGIVNDTMAFSYINAIGLAGDTIAVADGANRVVLLTKHLEWIRSIGRTGKGPGEFNRPWDVQFWNGGWVVSDMGNARLTFFDNTGAIVREVSVPGPRGSAVALTSAGEVIVPIASDSTYARRFRENRWEPWARRRSAPVADLASERANTLIQDWLCLTSGDTLHVLDARTLDLLKYAPDGSLVMHRYIREDLRALLLEDSGLHEELFGGRPVIAYRPPVREMVRGPDDEIWIPVPPPPEIPDLFALVVDPRSYDLRLVHAGVAAEPPGSPPRRMVLAVDRANIVTAEMTGRIRVYAYGLRGR